MGSSVVGSSGATYDVYPLRLRGPNDGPRTLVSNPADPAFSPFGWHDTNGAGTADSTLTSGNNVNAFADLADTGLPAFQPDGGPSLTFDFPQNLSQDPSSYMSAAVTQLFYITNELHDIHASYGFTEAAGNFQQINYGGQGAGTDALQAEAQDGGGSDNSNMFVPPDGQSPVMQMYLWDKTSPPRDGDFDNQIIIHEYGHGVSTRLTGGPGDSNSLFVLQSGGMGEGWSDWWALMFTQRAFDAQNGAYGMANYVIGQDPSSPGGAIDGGGIRQFPYSFDLTKDPLTFADFGTNTEVHASGTIWASALWDLNWLLIDKYGFRPIVSKGYDPNVPGENGGNNLALKLVMDALKIQPSNPSFTDARDAIIAADLALNGGQDLLQIWTAFARRGLGFSTIDAGSASGTITPAFDLPPSLQSPRVLSQSPTGTVTSTISSVDFTFNQAMNPTSFSVADDVDSFIGPGGADLQSSISGFSWLNGNTTLHVTFSTASANGHYTLTIGPNILSAGSETPMDQNANGAAGEASDTYSASFGFTTNQLAVTSITPANGAVAVLPATQIDVHFNQAVDPSSVSIFNLGLNRGQVTDAALVDPTTVQYTLSGFNFEGTVNATLAAGALRDLGGADSAAFSSSFKIDVRTTAFPTPFCADAAPLVWERTTSGTISPAGA